MNIFATDSCPTECARALDDKRLGKMLIETGQLLSAAIWNNDGEGFYRRTHMSHPCAVWAGWDRCNYIWLSDHWQALALEWQIRFIKEHGAGCEENAVAIHRGLEVFGVGEGMTPFPECLPDDLRLHPEGVHEAYRQCLRRKWAEGSPKWTKRGAPKWITREKETASGS